MPLMDKLSLLIPRVLHKRGLKDEASASYVTYLACQWIDDNLPEQSMHLRVVRLAGKCLFIDSDHSIASQELTQVQEHIISYLNTHEGVSIDQMMIARSRNTAN